MLHKILVVVDAQKDFIDGALANPVAQERVQNIVEKIKNFDGDYIFVTRDTHQSDYMSTKEGEKLPIIHCVENTPGWELNEDVAKALEAKTGISMHYINKPTFGSNILVNEISWLKGPLNIEIVGFCTDICVVSNALLIKSKVYDRANITVDASCCAGVTPETHIAALETMSKCQINVTNMEKVKINLVPAE